MVHQSVGEAELSFRVLKVDGIHLKKNSIGARVRASSYIQEAFPSHESVE